MHGHFLCYSHPVPLVQTYLNVCTYLGGYKDISGRLSLCFLPYHEDIDFSQMLGRFRDLASHHPMMYFCWVVESQEGFQGHLLLVYRCHSEMELVIEQVMLHECRVQHFWICCGDLMPVGYFCRSLGVLRDGFAVVR